MSPIDSYRKVQDRIQAETLYVDLGDALVQPGQTEEFRDEAKQVRRAIERDYGPQGRTSWVNRKYVTIKKPIRGRISLVLHDEVTREPTRVLSESEISPSMYDTLLRLLQS